jgi:Putative prokaryotic signal transducing protein
MRHAILGRKSDMTTSDLVEVANFASEAEAELARSFLEIDGIAALVQRVGGAAVGPVDMVLQGVRLLVELRDEERARKILSAMKIKDS